MVYSEKRFRRGQALTVPRAIMLFSALLMAILIVRMVGYHYTVSDRQQQTFRFMLKASDVAKKLISSEECLSLETFSQRGVISKQKLDSFQANYSEHEPGCAYDYDLGWRARVVEKPFTYSNPAVITSLGFSPGDWLNASRLLLMTSSNSSVSLTNSTGTSSVQVNGFEEFRVNDLVNFSHPSGRVWGVGFNYNSSAPREFTRVGTVGSLVCHDCLEGFDYAWDDDHHASVPEEWSEYDVFVLNWTNVDEGESEFEDFLRSGGGMVVVDNDFSEWESFFGQELSSGEFYPCSELLTGCNLSSGVYFRYSFPDELGGVIDLVGDRGGSDLISMYGVDFMTFVHNRLWLVPEFDTRVRVSDESDGDDFVDLSLRAGEGRFLSGFENDVVRIEADRPLWIVSGVLGGYVWLEGANFTFPCFGNFSLLASDSTTISLKAKEEGDFVGGSGLEDSFTLPAGDFVNYSTHESGFRWVSVNSSSPVLVQTWSGSGLVERFSERLGEEFFVFRGVGVGNVTVCAGGHAVSLGDASLSDFMGHTVSSGSCERVSDEEAYFFTSEESFLVIDSLGGEGAAQSVRVGSGDVRGAVAIADRVGADVLEPESVSGEYNLFFIYRVTAPFELPSTPKGIVLLYNDWSVFDDFGLDADPVSVNCTDWLIQSNSSLFSNPHNITEAYLETYSGDCSFYHVFDSLFGLGASEEDLRTIVGFKFTDEGDFLLAGSIKPFRDGYLDFVENMEAFVLSNLFSSEEGEWVFGVPEESVSVNKRQEITLNVPVAVYYNESKVRPGVLDLTVFSGELEQVRGLVERACVDENVSEVVEISLSSPVRLVNDSVCQLGSCQALVCDKNVSLSLKSGFRIIRVSSNETGVFIG